MAVISYQVEEDDRPSPKSNLVRARFAQAETLEETEGYIEAPPEVEALANHLITTYPDSLGHLRSTSIKYLMSKKPKASQGKPVYGSAKAFSDKDRHLHPYQFLVVLDLNFWDENTHLNEPLLFSWMIRCQFNEKDKAYIARPDAEMSFDEIRIFGAWQEDIRTVNRQLDMFKQQEESNA